MVTDAAENRCRRLPRPHLRPTINEDGHVLKSRRGLLAAGLAVAVVGALGVASTLNAGAEQIVGTDQTAGTSDQPFSVVDPTDSAAAPAGSADADDTSTPPPLLPWGAHPEEVSKGEEGASSQTLRSDGLDA